MTEQQPVTFTGEELIEILESQSSQRALRVTSGEVRNNGNEAGFEIHTTPDKRVFIPFIRFGEKTRLLRDDGGGEQEFMGGYKTLHQIQGKLLNLHFHPEEDPIVPSNSDLHTISISTAAPEHLPSILAVGALRANGGIEMLLMRRPSLGVLFSDSIQEYSEHIDPYPFSISREQVTAALSIIGVKSFLIRFNYRRRRYSLDDASKELLLDFDPITVSLV